MSNTRYPPSSNMYRSNRDFPSRHGHPTHPIQPVTLQEQTGAPVCDRDPKPHRSLGARTPSPTPSEAAELSRVGAFDWQRLTQWRFWLRREWFWYYIVLILVCAVTTLVTLYHQEIVHFLRPAADWMHDFPAGFAIPIAVLFIISFPPLFGHEIVAILCGLVWGLWVGFGIVCAGTFLGEVGNFYAFKYCCRSRGEKLERTNITYGCLAKVVRDGGLIIALIARLSAIPGHFTTAVFSTCGMGILVFSLAAVLSLPKQFVTVYLGVALEQAANGEKTSTQDRVLKYGIIGTTLVITVWAMWYIYARMGKVKVQVIYERRKARQMKNDWGTAESDDRPPHRTIVSSPLPTRSFNPDNTFEGQRWDEHGNAIGWSNEFPLQPTKHAVRPTAGEAQDPPNHGRDFVTRSNVLEHSTGPHKNGREVLATSYESRQHLRTRSLSGFHRNVTR